jgi:hypothetical protein
MHFDNGVFEAKRPSCTDNDLPISEHNPFSDIFYFLQSIAPSMLLLVRLDKIEIGDSTRSWSAPGHLDHGSQTNTRTRSGEYKDIPEPTGCLARPQQSV